MNYPYVTQHQGIVAWSGTAARPIDLRHHVNFGFTFEVVADILADAIFNVQSAPASDADPCLPGPFVPVAEVLTCRADWSAVPAPQATMIIPAGTKAGAVCVASLPCKPDAFLQIVSGGGDTANVRAVVVLSSPR